MRAVQMPHAKCVDSPTQSNMLDDKKLFLSGPRKVGGGTVLCLMFLVFVFLQFVLYSVLVAWVDPFCTV